MALVDTDLFLVQDASTKTNYKVTYANLTADISADIVDDIDFTSEYVNVDGDNMTGDLTLGPVGDNKITLNAASGSGTFAGNLYGDYLKTGNSLTGTGGISIYGDASSTLGIVLNTNGNVAFGADASFTGDVTAASFSGDGSNLTNLPASSPIWEETGNDIAPITPDTNLIEIGSITASGNITTTGDIGGNNAVFTGTLEADSIDGGSYA